MEQRDKKTATSDKIFYISLFLIITASIVLTFVKIVINKDYQITAEVSCNSATESCFVYKCDPAEDNTCPTNPQEQYSYYKIISKRASAIQACEATEEKIGCGEELSCIEGERSCFYTYNNTN